MVTEDDVRDALKAVKYPGYSRDIVSFGLIKQLAINKGAISLTLQLTGGNAEVAQQIKTSSEQVLKALPGVQMTHVEVKHQGAPASAGAQNPWAQQSKIPGIRRVVAVASGKGGV